MKWRVMIAGSLACAAIGSACANDARLLYERGVGEAGADVAPPPTGRIAGSGGTAGSGGAMFPTGAGGDPPAPVECPPPGQEFCECDAFDYCFCEPTPEQEYCAIFCAEGYCGMDCGAATSCDMFCEVGCELFCPSGSSCMVACGGGCNVVCEPGSHCIVDSLEGPSSIVCQEGAICDCVDPQMCFCEGPGCPPTMGP